MDLIFLGMKRDSNEGKESLKIEKCRMKLAASGAPFKEWYVHSVQSIVKNQRNNIFEDWAVLWLQKHRMQKAKDSTPIISPSRNPTQK